MSFLKILRPFNCLFVGLTVLFGAFYNKYIDWNLPVIAAMFSAIFIAGAGYVINDYYDLEIDRINKPQRVLPSGLMSIRTAFFYAFILFFAGILISFLTESIFCIIIAVANSLFLLLYARHWKKSFLTGNLLVSYAAASTFLYGGLAAQNFRNSLVITTFAFFYTLLREITKDSEDARGDQAGGAGTLALKLGESRTWLISWIPVLIIFSLILALYSYDYYNSITFILLTTLVSLPLILIMTYLKHSKNKHKFANSSRWMKIDMLVLLLINWIG